MGANSEAADAEGSAGGGNCAPAVDIVGDTAGRVAAKRVGEAGGLSDVIVWEAGESAAVGAATTVTVVYAQFPQP